MVIGQDITVPLRNFWSWYPIVSKSEASSLYVSLNSVGGFIIRFRNGSQLQSAKVILSESFHL
jgi:hypothetical protein